MAIKRFEADMNIIQQLGDHPNLDNEMSAEEIKAKFDEAGNEIKEYLNETVAPAIDALDGKAVSHDTAITTLKTGLSNEIQTRSGADSALHNEIVAVDEKFEANKAVTDTRLTNVELGHVATDNSLTRNGIPANAKVVGDRFNNILSDVSYRCRFSGGKLIDPVNGKSAVDLGASLLAAYRAGKNVVIFDEIDKGNGDIEEPYIREFVCAGFRDNREDLILFFCRVEGDTVETINVNCSDGTLSQTTKEIGTSDVYEAEYNYDSQKLIRGNFNEMRNAYNEGKIVTLKTEIEADHTKLFYCVGYTPFEFSGTEGDELIFHRTLAGGIEMAIVDSVEGRVIESFVPISGLNTTVGQKTEQGGTIFNDCETNQATAEFATAFGSESKAAAKGAIAAGMRIPKSGANITYDDEGRQVAVNEEDWRYNEAYGYGSEAFGKGAVAYSRASKSFGYRTQTGYPPSAEHANARPEAIVQTDADGNPTYPADNVGQGAVAIGADTAALFNHTLAGGWGAIARNYNALAFGDHPEANGEHSVSLNYKTKANAMGAIAAGSGTEVNGKYAFGGGLNGKVNGNYSIGGGMKYEVDGNFSITQGLENKARSNCAAVFGAGLITPQQMVNGSNTGKGYALSLLGQYNAYANGELDNALLAVGYGTSDKSRKNAFVVNKDGSAKLAGALSADGATFERTVTMDGGLMSWGTSTFLADVEIAGKLTFDSIDSSSRKRMFTYKSSSSAPDESKAGDYVGQLWRQENDSGEVIAVYMYCGYTAATGSKHKWIKLG